MLNIFARRTPIGISEFRVNLPEEDCMVRVGVIGYGYWGPNLVRNFFETSDRFAVTTVSDQDAARLAVAKSRYPSIATTLDATDIIQSPQTDAVAIATPVSTHFQLARQSLLAGKHVFVEKPLASTVREAEELVELAAARNLVLMVDHTFVYTGAVRKMRELVAAGVLGELYYYDSTRVNLGLFQHDVNVIWDLAVHDLSILDYVVAEQPCAVSATGVSHIPGKVENLAYVTMFFESSLMGHLNVNWLAPVKVRRTLLGGSKKMVVYDDVEPSEKIKIYDKGVDVGETEDIYRRLISYRSGDVLAPQLDITEALRTEASEFADSIEQNRRPLTDGEAGLRVVRILAAATQSMQLRGRLITI